MAWTMLRAVRKLGWRSDSSTVSPLSKSEGISRSTVAPLGMRPEVGVLTVTLEPLLPVAFKPPTTSCPWAMA